MKRWFVIIFSGITLFILIIISSFFLETFNERFLSSLSAVSTAFAAVGGIMLLIVTYKTLIEMKAQRQPAITLRLLPDSKNINLFNFVLKNTGGSPAYDLNVTFTPDISYNNSSLNRLNMFKHMPLLDKDEEVIIFFDSVIEYFETDNPKQVTAEVSYYNFLSNKGKSSKQKRKFYIDFEERRGQLALDRKDMDDLVKEIEELKHALLLINYERNDENG